ncbi:MAG: hypothetical protein H6Q72_613 [Firmicutes bacterium]|nr:hypothetical protein [Bacillota bacterium]
MSKYSIICICQIYNEIEKGNLERFINYVRPLVDAMVIYDDGSTDGSYEHMLTVTPHVIRGVKNSFANERMHKQKLLTEALMLNPDFILWLDADEVLCASTAENLQNLCHYCIQNNFDGVSLRNVNIWRSETWERLDSCYDAEWFVRLWRVTPEIAFDQLTPALHQQPYPDNLEKIVCVTNFRVLHYGFSTSKNLAYRYLRVESKGLRGYSKLDRLISEETLVLEQVPIQEFPEGLWVDDDPPIAISFKEALSEVEKYRETVFFPPGESMVEPKPVVSIVMPTYNQDQFIAQSIQSVIDQTFAEWELIIVNDGSTDNTVNIISQYNKYHHSKSRIIIINKETNQGIAAALNDGLCAARGKYICWLSSDDLFTANKLEKQVAFLELHSEYGAVFSGYDWINETGNYLGTIIEKELEGAAFYKILFERDCIHGCTIMIRKVCLDEVGLFNPVFNYAQDYDMWLRLAVHANIAYLPEVFVKGRIHSKAGTNEGKNEIDAIGVTFTFILTNTSSPILFKKAGFDNSIDALKWILEKLYDQFCNRIGELMQIRRGIEWILSNCKIPEDASNFITTLDKKIECQLNSFANQTKIF